MGWMALANFRKTSVVGGVVGCAGFDLVIIMESMQEETRVVGSGSKSSHSDQSNAED